MNPEIRMAAHIRRRDKIAGAPARSRGHVLMTLPDCQNERPRDSVPDADDVDWFVPPVDSMPPVEGVDASTPVAHFTWERSDLAMLIFLSLLCWLAVCGAISLAAFTWWMMVGPGLGMLR